MGMLDTSGKKSYWAYVPLSMDASYYGELQLSERLMGGSLPFLVVPWTLKATEGEEVARKGALGYEMKWLLRGRTKRLPKSAR